MNLYASHDMHLNYKAETGIVDISTAIVKYFNTLLSIADRTNRQKISSDIEDLDKIINKCDLAHLVWLSD